MAPPDPAGPPAGASDRNARLNRLMKLWAAAAGLAWLVLPFVAAGTLRWPGMWIMVGTIASGSLVQRVYLSRTNPEILARRKGLGEGTKAWDVAWMLVAAPLTILMPLVAGFGVRAGWPSMPWPFAILGFAINTTTGVLWARAMASNVHFEMSVRIQNDRGHSVVDTGPYRFVRHPGYAAFFAGLWGTPLLLLSWPAFAAAPLFGSWLLVRAALEDATLRRELPGYADYARRVRYRIVPGVW
jgi:protein-S-isoprenylcysteine O-methyltransferase Ste14